MSKVVINNIEVKNKNIDINYTKGLEINGKYIIIHSIQASKFYSIDSYYRYISTNPKAKESVHYLISDKEIVKVLEHNKRGLHVKKSNIHNISNSTSIGVAIILRENMDPLKVFNNLVSVIQYLMHELDIPIKNVLRHSDISDTECPIEFKEEFIWHKLKLSVSNILEEAKPIGVGEIYSILSKLKIKEEPYEESKTIGHIEKGEAFYIYEDDGSFVKAILDLGEKMGFGYLAKDFVKYEKITNNELFEEDEAEDELEEKNIEEVKVKIDSDLKEKQEEISELDKLVIKEVIKESIDIKEEKSKGLKDEEYLENNNLIYEETSLDEKIGKNILEDSNFCDSDIEIEEIELDFNIEKKSAKEESFKEEKEKVIKCNKEKTFEEEFIEEDEVEDIIRRDEFGNIIREDFERMRKARKNINKNRKTKFLFSNGDEEEEISITMNDVQRITMEDMYLNKKKKNVEKSKIKNVEKVKASKDNKKVIAIEQKEEAKKVVKERLETIVNEKEKESKKKTLNMGKLGIVEGANINLEVRKEPSDESFVLAYLLNGKEVRVLRHKNGWYQVEYETMYEKRRGFVHKQYIKLL